MARPLRIQYPGAYYHVINRGLERRDIFKSAKDFEYFLGLLEQLNLKYNLIVHSYCLMSNHYHLFLETPNGQLSKVMRQLDGIYTQKYNKRYSRVGPLMQGRYKATLIDKDNYSLELSRYIHLNPVRAKIVDSPEKYQWSSFPAFIKKAESPKFLNTNWLLSQFNKSTKKAVRFFKHFTSLGLAENWSPEKDLYKGIMLGNSEFISDIQDKYLSGKVDSEIPLLGKAQKEISHKSLLEHIAALTSDVSLRTKLTALMLKTHSSLKLREIAGLTNSPSYPALGMMINRFEKYIGKSRQLKNLVENLDRYCQNVKC